MRRPTHVARGEPENATPSRMKQVGRFFIRCCCYIE
jgi:hypothetical protein